MLEKEILRFIAHQLITIREVELVEAVNRPQWRVPHSPDRNAAKIMYSAKMGPDYPGPIFLIFNQFAERKLCWGREVPGRIGNEQAKERHYGILVFVFESNETAT